MRYSLCCVVFKLRLHCVALLYPSSRAVVACFFPRDPKSHSLGAKAHGRVGLAVKALELMLSVIYAMQIYFGAQERFVRGHDSEVDVACASVLSPSPSTTCCRGSRRLEIILVVGLRVVVKMVA